MNSADLLEAIDDDLDAGEYETGATSGRVNNAMLCMQSDSSLYPPKVLSLAQIRLQAMRCKGVDFESLKIRHFQELLDLWNSWARDHREDCVNNGWTDYDECLEKGSGPRTFKPEKDKPVIHEITDVNHALSRMPSKGARLELPQDVRFSKKCYDELKDLMIRAGGKYSKNGFAFKGKDAQDIKSRLMAGEVIDDKKKFQQFYTPPEVVKIVRDLAGPITDAVVLEPSAGRGALVEGIPKSQVRCCELDPENREYLLNEGYTLVGDDFMEFDPGYMFDVILANPPFTNNQDIRHVQHMYDLLADGGVLVSVMSIGWKTGNNKLQKEFRNWLQEKEATVIEIDQGAFRSSGTSIATCLVKLEK